MLRVLVCSAGEGLLGAQMASLVVDPRLFREQSLWRVLIVGIG